MVLVKCPRCGYAWNYKGKRRYATCPRCYTKFSVAANAVPCEHDIDTFLASGKRVMDTIKECAEELGGKFNEGDGGADIDLPDGGWKKLVECVMRKGAKIGF